MLPDPPRPADPHRLFDEKWPSVRRLARAELRPDLRADHVDEVLSLAGLILWQQCRRCCDPQVPPFAIDTLRLARWALSAWAKQQRREREHHVVRFSEATEPYNVPTRPEPSIVVDGVRLTVRDAEQDHPREVAVLCDGIDAPTLAARLGVTRQRVHQRRHELGGVQLPGHKGRWRFPVDAGRNVAVTSAHASKRAP